MCWKPILLWRKWINIGHLFYYGENGSILDTYFTMEKTDQYWTIILLWRKRINIGHLFYHEENVSILDNYFTMEKWINIGHIFNSYYSGEADQYGHIFYSGKMDFFFNFTNAMILQF